MAGPADAGNDRTSGSAVTLALTVDELRTLLADNTDLVSGLFATLAERSTNPIAGPPHQRGARARDSSPTAG